MTTISKKRTAAIFIDFAISTAVTVSVEKLLRKKIKNEAVHALVTPTLVMWVLEYGQLKRCGQTAGYKMMGLALENEDGGEPTSNQLLKRLAYRDTVSSFRYLKDRKGFTEEDGALLPHDRYAGTIVKEVESC
ncbi:RDD family protein [Halobacillus sp. B23F22_1]|uniref:RDD family protein n=1 Tax=Halobacillus sp. B23F22_1 TaxID=3459514 RepID=UPI00373F8227